MGNRTRPGPDQSSHTFGANTDFERGGMGAGQEAGHTGWLEEEVVKAKS